MRTAGRAVGLSMVFILAATALIPLACPGALAQSQVYMIRPPADFVLDNQYSYGNGSTGLDIYYDPTKLSNDGDVKVYADQAFGTITSFFGPYDYRITLILAADHDQYVSLLNPDPIESQNISTTEVASNYGYATNGTIVIEVPGLVPDFEAVLTQQISEIVMRTNLIAYKYSVPDWFSTGLANYISGNISNDSRSTIDSLCSQGKLMSISQMEGLLENADSPTVDANDLSVAEAQASLLMEYIGTYFGNSTINLILTDFGPTGDMNKAFVSATSLTPDQINAQWQGSLNITLINQKFQAIAQRIYGYVFDPDGHPVPNQSITLLPAAGGQPLQVTTDSSGFYLLNLSSGTFTAHLTNFNYSTIDRTITLNTSQVLEYNFTFAVPAPVPVGSPATAAASGVNSSGGSSGVSNGNVYLVLAVVNASALALIVLVFWRTRK